MKRSALLHPGKLLPALLACGILATACNDETGNGTAPARHPGGAQAAAPSSAPSATSTATAAATAPAGATTAPASDFSGDTAYIHCARLCDLGPRPSGSPAYARQLDYLTQQLRDAGWQTRRQTFPSPRAGINFTNLHAFYSPASDSCAPAAEAQPSPADQPASTAGSTTPSPASPPGEPHIPERPMLLTCHIDTKTGIPRFVGADDGASGAAVLLELARVLAARHPGLATRIELVFFDGEESFAPRMTLQDGLYGSRYDLARRGAKLPRWMINLDMVGGRDKVIAIPMADTSEAMLMHYDTAVNALGLSPKHWTVYPGSYLDDHLPFAQAGVHTLNLIAYFQHGNWWHTERDNLSRISPDSLRETGRLVLRLLKQIME